jgi:hypothetical protein
MGRVVKITPDITVLGRALVRDDPDLASRAMEVLEQAELVAIAVSEPAGGSWSPREPVPAELWSVGRGAISHRKTRTAKSVKPALATPFFQH